MITYSKPIPVKRIGATHKCSLKTPYNVSDYSAITATLRSKTSDRQEVAKFAKVASEGIFAIRPDALDPKKFYCDIPATSTAKAYEATYEMVFELSRTNANYSTGLEIKVIVVDIVKFVQ